MFIFDKMIIYNISYNINVFIIIFNLFIEYELMLKLLYIYIIKYNNCV